MGRLARLWLCSALVEAALSHCSALFLTCLCSGAELMALARPGEKDEQQCLLSLMYNSLISYSEASYLEITCNGLCDV